MNWTPPDIAIRPATASDLAQARKLSDSLGLPLLDAALNDTSSPSTAQWMLIVSPETLTLSRADGLSTSIDFLGGKAAKRTHESGFASQPLARALGLKKLQQINQNPTVIDATAGLGTDGWMMASLQCRVHLLEASPVLCAMLKRAIDIAAERTSDGAAHRLTITNTNAVSYLNNEATSSVNVIYLDPMYPQSRNSALVKKGMQLLHDLAGPDTNGDELLLAALAKADYRVIVKRPKGAALLAGSDKWSGQITNIQSAQTRFDIYHLATG